MGNPVRIGEIFVSPVQTLGHLILKGKGKVVPVLN
jgi:hypothetical protein